MLSTYQSIIETPDTSSFDRYSHHTAEDAKPTSGREYSQPLGSKVETAQATFTHNSPNSHYVHSGQ